MARQNRNARPFQNYALTGLVLSVAFATLGCDAIVNTKGRPACTTNSECTARFGEPSMCVESACTKLLSTECTEVWPPNALSQDNTILIGYLGELTGLEYGTPPMEGVKLALSERETNDNGFPGVTADAPRRHLAMLVCDQGKDPVAVAKHLVQDARVPLIIGASFSGTTLKVYDGVAAPANVMMLSPSATSPALSMHGPLFWRTAPSDVVQAELLKYLKVDVEDLLHKEGALAAGAPATVVMPTKNDSAGNGLANAARAPDPPVPGRAPAISQGLNAFLYDDPITDDQVWQKLSQKVLDAKPDIIMAMGTSEFVSNMLPKIELGWDASNKGPHPWYVLPEGDRAGDLLTFTAKHPELMLNQRVIGTAPGARRSPLYQDFRRRFQTFFSEQEPGNLAEFGYDAGYLALYAIAIAKETMPTGPELAEAMKHMSCKEAGTLQVPVGPATMDPFPNVAAAGCIDFDGASGPLDFDPDAGEAVSDIATWCLHKTSTGFSFDPTLDSYYSVETSSVAVADGGKALDLSSDGWCGPGQ